MPRTTDLTLVRSLLDRDRPWAAYAIGDLSSALAAECEWRVPADGAPALLLLYRGFVPPIAFAMGAPDHLAPLFQEIDAAEISLHIQPEAIAALQPAYQPVQTRPMWRMVVEPGSFTPAPIESATKLGDSDLESLTALYDDGHPHGEGPTFFHPAMLRQGTFYGIREGADLIAVAGTHLVSPELSVCTVGNVYTRRDRRRQGLGARVTSAVVTRALADGIATIVLNVSQENAGARRVYEQLGFRCYCSFVEGEAVSASSPTRRPPVRKRL